MIKQICEIGNFIRRLRTEVRFGELSRAPLQLLRLEWRGDAVECDWMARAADPWDAGLPTIVAERNTSVQALEDAVNVRDLLFSTLPDLSSGVFRVYREAEGAPSILIIAGKVTRKERVPAGVRSLAMRAKLVGFRFWLADGVLKPLQLEEREMSL
jgi:hypothetical protein